MKKTEINWLEMKPIHKFNDGNGATLCHRCRTIISTGFTKDLYCSDHCKNKHQNIKPNVDN